MTTYRPTEEASRLQDPHPDASLLTGFVEQALTPYLYGQTIDHLLKCATCRRVIALASPVRQLETTNEWVIVPQKSPWFARLRWAAVTAGVTLAAGAALLLGPARLATISSPANRPAPQTSAVTSEQTPATAQQIADVKTQPSEMAKTRRGNAKIEHPPEDARPLDMVNTGIEVQPSPRLPGNGARGGAAAVPFVSSQQGGAVIGRDVAPAPWTLGDAGALYRFAYGRGRWERVNVGGHTSFESLAFSGSTVWVITDNGLLFRSSDGGRRWIKLPPMPVQSTSNTALTVRFRDSRNGEISNAQGRRWFSGDGGETWH